MSRDEELLPDEKALLHVNRHPLVLISRTWWVTLLALVVLVVGVAWTPPAGFLRDGRLFIVLVILLAAFVYFDIQFILWRSESYTITDQRIILRRGVVSKYSRSIGMTRVQDVTTFQGALGRVFDYGNVEVESAGRDGAEVLTFVPHPTEFRNVLFECLHGGSAGAGGGGGVHD
jgi:uncharacterized membrane protein YdbT with pleckstrin-like domain